MARTLAGPPAPEPRRARPRPWLRRRRGYPSALALGLRGRRRGLLGEGAGAYRPAAEAETRHLDLTGGLPFPDAHFGAIVASLCLHYFPWSETVEVLEDVRRCLVPGGHLLARVNSTNDLHYAAARREEIEPNFYLVDGSPKRLFDRGDVAALFRPGWKIEDAAERTTSRYGGEKTLWEIVARKPAS